MPSLANYASQQGLETLPFVQVAEEFELGASPPKWRAA